ncbi:MAG: C-GCAxxG-C-C family protein [Oscillospiraceae bacterium]|jgi:C_GCAxxG_C_C family probable redox protein
MTKLERAEQLRADETKDYNCCQSSLLPFCQECHLDEETALKLSANFGSGMRHGSTCGAVTGALMALGLSGLDEKKASALIRKFKAKNGALTCRELLAKNTGDLKSHCDGKVFDAVQIAMDLLEEEKAANNV